MKTLFTFFIVILANQCLAQTNIDGIGYFRINSSFQEVIAKLDSEKVDYVDMRKLSKSDQLMNCVYAVHPFTTTLWIKRYDLFGIKLIDLQLFFYHDSLFRVHTKGNLVELESAVTIKYGKPNIKREEVPVTCTYTYTGAKTTYIGYQLTTTWRDNNVSCFNFFSKYYNDECKERFIHYFKLADTTVEYEVQKLALKQYDREKIDDEEEKKRKYKDFK